MPFADNDGVRLHWDEKGAGSPVLLVMGHRLSSAMWYPVIPALADRHRVIWFDNRGTAQSDAPRTVTFTDLVEDAVAVLDAAGVDRAHAYGVSMGGGVVLELAMNHPGRVRSIVLGATCIFSSDKPRPSRWLNLSYYVPFRYYAARTKRRLYGRSTPRNAIDHDVEMICNDRYEPRGVIAQARAMRRYSTTRDAVAAIDKPALVLHGTEDRVVPFEWGEELASTLANAQLVPVPGAGHCYVVADPGRVNDEVPTFFASVDSR